MLGLPSGNMPRPCVGSSAAHAAPPVPEPVAPTHAMRLLELPDELVYECGVQALVQDGRSLLRFLQASKRLQHLFKPLRLRAEERRLRWDAAVTLKHTISGDGRTLTAVHGDGGVTPWAAGCVLPTAGKSAWKVQVETSSQNIGHIVVGVCDAAAARHGWGLALSNGHLCRYVLWATSSNKHLCREADGSFHFRALPPISLDRQDWPDGHGEQVMKDEAGQPADLVGRAVGAIIEVLVDHDEGTLSFQVNGGPLLVALKGESKFPRHAALRPFARCSFVDDSVRLLTPILAAANGANGDISNAGHLVVKAVSMDLPSASGRGRGRGRGRGIVLGGAG